MYFLNSNFNKIIYFILMICVASVQYLSQYIWDYIIYYNLLFYCFRIIYLIIKIAYSTINHRTEIYSKQFRNNGNQGLMQFELSELMNYVTRRLFNHLIKHSLFYVKVFNAIYNPILIIWSAMWRMIYGKIVF